LKPKELVTVDIESLAYGGEGIGRVQQKVVFVPLTAPGDRVEISLSESKKNYSRGTIERFETLSPFRTVPLCDYYGVCGGCQWQHLKYDFQLRTKQEIVRTNLERIGQIHDFELLPILPAPSVYGYRSRVHLQCSTGRSYTLGFFKMNTHEVVAIEHCDLLPRFHNKILRQLNECLRSLEHLIVFNEIEIAAHAEKQEALLSFSAESFPKDRMIPFLKSLKHSIPDVYGIALHSGNTSEAAAEHFGNCWLEFEERVHPRGCEEPFVLAKRVHVDTFSQVNLEQNVALIQTLYEWLDASGKETLIDLFCGMGNLSLAVARKLGRVIGIENNLTAVDDARYNAQRNNFSHCEFIHADAVAGLQLVRDRGIQADVVFVDPPRKGCKEVLPEIARLRPPRIFYVSCNPTTLARDIKLLSQYDYRLRRIQPIDMFPQTYHIETVAELHAV
jgi:23S rRNA (uracil1939-C5)-methyltransferase